MTDHDYNRKPASTSLQTARRRFLQQTMLVTAGTSVQGILRPSIAETGENAVALPPKCSHLEAPMREVEDKVAFITGGSSGIGLGIARAFSDAKMRVVIGYRTKKHLQEALEVLKDARDRVHAIDVDVTDRACMENAATETIKVFGKIHVLVNNAGVVGFAPMSSTTSDDWDWMMNVNVNGVFNGLQAFLPRIRTNGEGGHVISTASIAGLFSFGGSVSYTASKFAVVGMMESLRAELSSTNIGASVVCPGMVRSKIIDSKRNRPTTLTNSGFNTDPEQVERVRNNLNNPDLAMDPFLVGRLVLRGMRNNDLYILTHAEHEQTMRERNEALIASIPMDAPPNDARVTSPRPPPRNSIYNDALTRRVCSHSAGHRR